jgi:hypothetical protein
MGGKTRKMALRYEQNQTKINIFGQRSNSFGPINTCGFCRVKFGGRAHEYGTISFVETTYTFSFKLIEGGLLCTES